MNWFLELPLFQQAVILYFFGINLTTFLFFVWDKMRAGWHEYRVREKTLWLLTLIGGSLGAILAMHFFRHKTKKLSFQAVMAIILAAQVMLIYWLFLK